MAPSLDPGLPLLPDVSLRGEGQDIPDGLGFDNYASALRSAVLATRGPLTIGIYGDWGTGKTSLMRLIEERLKADESKVVTIWFNAWRYQSDESSTVALVQAIQTKLQEREGLLGEAEESFIAGLRGIAAGLKVEAKIKVPLLAEFKVSGDANKALDREKEVREFLGEPSIYSQAFKHLDKVDLPKDTRIVVFVDDLDRCLPSEAIRLLESVKLVLGFAGFIFFLGLSRKVIEGYLQHRYASDFGIPDFDGTTYLDKIVQLPFVIPAHRGRMNDLLASMLARVDVRQRDHIEKLWPVLRVAAGENPRSAVRFVNSILLDQRILSVQDGQEHAHLDAGEHVALVAVSRALQQRWDRVYTALNGDSPLCETVVDWGDDVEALKKAAAGSDSNPPTEQERKRSAIAAAILANNDLRDLFCSEYGKLWLSDEPKRIVAGSYLHEEGQHSEEHVGPARRHDAFFSYRMTNRREVSEVAKILGKQGLKVFWDLFLKPGTNWRQQTIAELRDSRSLVFFFGKETPGNVWQKRELKLGTELAAKSDDFRIIPVLLPGADIDQLDEEAREWIWVDLRQDGVSETSIKALVTALNE